MKPVFLMNRESVSVPRHDDGDLGRSAFRRGWAFVSLVAGRAYSLTRGRRFLYPHHSHVRHFKEGM